MFKTAAKPRTAGGSGTGEAMVVECGARVGHGQETPPEASAVLGMAPGMSVVAVAKTVRCKRALDRERPPEVVPEMAAGVERRSPGVASINRRARAIPSAFSRLGSSHFVHPSDPTTKHLSESQPDSSSQLHDALPLPLPQ